MKQSCFQAFICASLFFACCSPSSAQIEIGIRPLFFSNDFSNHNGHFEGVAQGRHAGEWQFGVSGRRYLSERIAGRLETNLTLGRYPASTIRFSYLNFCALPEWHASESVFFGPGVFVNANIKDPFDGPKKISSGLLANVGFRHGPFEIQFRFQHWLGSSGKFTLGAGLDYFFGLNKKSHKEEAKTGS